MKKILLVSGSPRLHGNTHQILEACGETIRERGVETDLITLSDTPIGACVACYKCETEQGRCSGGSDLDEIMERFRTADGVLVGCPVYFGTCRGDLLNLLQRVGMVSLCGDRFLAGKIGAAFAVARHPNYPAAIEEMLAFFNISGAYVPDSLYRTNVVGRLPGEALNDRTGMHAVLQLAADMAEQVQHRSSY